MSAANRIIESLKDAIAGNFARVRIDGQMWTREPGWQPIKTAPERPMPVLFYHATAEWRDMRGAVVEVPGVEGAVIRYDTGYWDGETWRESCTNHEVFELDPPGVDLNKPTHWMSLPEPPEAHQ